MTRGAMTMLAEIERDGVPTKDDWGHDGKPQWSMHLTVACRAWVAANRTPSLDDVNVLVQERKILVPQGTDVTRRDRIARVTDRRGETLFEGPALIESVTRRPDHFEILLQESR